MVNLVQMEPAAVNLNGVELDQHGVNLKTVVDLTAGNRLQAGVLTSTLVQMEPAAVQTIGADLTKTRV